MKTVCTLSYLEHVNAMKLFFQCLLTFITEALFAQTITLSGTVRDKTSLDELAYASISIKGKAIGTVTNLTGEFDFHFPADNKNELLVVSMLGYVNFEAPIWSFDGMGSIVIELDRSTTYLKEVLVEDSLTGGDILRIALLRLNENLPQQPYLLDGFYRDIKKVGGTYISLLESALQIYDENSLEPRNKHRLKEQVKLLELRQSIGYESKFTTYFDQDNLLEDLLLNNNIRYRQIDQREEFFAVMQRKKDTFFDEREVYVVAYDGEYFFQIFIDKTDYSVIRFEFKKENINGDFIARKKGLEGRFIGTDKIVEFKRYKDKMYLALIKMTSKINWYDEKTKTPKFETELHQELLINKINTDPDFRIASTESMKKYGLQYQHLNYNKKFWETYNVIKRTPLDSQIIADLEKAGPLEKQFQDN